MVIKATVPMQQKQQSLYNDKINRTSSRKKTYRLLRRAAAVAAAAVAAAAPRAGGILFSSSHDLNCLITVGGKYSFCIQLPLTVIQGYRVSNTKCCRTRSRSKINTRL